MHSSAVGGLEESCALVSVAAVQMDTQITPDKRQELSTLTVHR